MRILQIEPDDLSAMQIDHTLTSKGIIVDRAEDCEDALHFAFTYDAAIVSELNDVVVLRRGKFDAPILMLSAKSDIPDRVAGLNAGADDYQPKPIHPRELLARLYAVVRRSKGYSHSVIETHGLTINLDTSDVIHDHAPVKLTRHEYQVVEMLVLAGGRTITKSAFLDNAYGGLDAPHEKILDVFVCKIRRKLTKLMDGKQPIETVWGLGYRWSEKLLEKNQEGGWRHAA